MAKANADYARLADETELLYDGIAARTKRTGAEIARLLKDVPNAEAIMQVFGRHAHNVATQNEIKARLDRYMALRDKPKDGESATS